MLDIGRTVEVVGKTAKSFTPSRGFKKTWLVMSLTMPPSDFSARADFSPRGDPVRPSSALEVRIQLAPNLPLVRLTGELDLDSLHLLTDAMNSIAATSCPAELVVLDLAGVTFCDVAGLRALEQCALALEMSGKQLMLYEAPRTVTRLMAMTGIATWLPVRN